MKIMIDISGHGLGHLAQISPLVHEFRSRDREVRFFVQSKFDHSTLSRFLGEPIERASDTQDLGLVMLGPSTVDVERSYNEYAGLHSRFDGVVDLQAHRLKDCGTELLISDISYVSLAGAARAGIPAYAVCSLHWGEVVRQYFGEREQVAGILAEIMDAYNGAARFFVPCPRQSVPDVERQTHVGLMARHWAKPTKAEILARAGMTGSRYLGLIGFGGIPHGLPALALPRMANWAWIIPDALIGQVETQNRGDIAPLGRLGSIDYLDILASCDLVLTKTGYSTFAECVTYGVPCLFLSRPDWPEAPEIERFMEVGGYGLPLSLRELTGRRWFGKAERLLADRRPAVKPTGHVEIADRIFADLGLSCINPT